MPVSLGQEVVKGVATPFHDRDIALVMAQRVTTRTVPHPSPPPIGPSSAGSGPPGPELAGERGARGGAKVLIFASLPPRG